MYVQRRINLALLFYTSLVFCRKRVGCKTCLADRADGSGLSLLQLSASAESPTSPPKAAPQQAPPRSRSDGAASAVPLTDEGLFFVQNLKKAGALKSFVHRVLAHEGLQSKDPALLESLILSFQNRGASKGKGAFANLRALLRKAPWVKPLHAEEAKKRPHHILFVMADDLRPELSPYGHNVRTPHMQHLASQGFTFQRAYVQQAVCGPSRTAILTGRRPDTSRVWSNMVDFRDTKGRDWRTLPQFFKEHGWRSIGIGKIFHESLGQDETVGGGSWSVKHKNHGDEHCHYKPGPEVPASLEVDASWDTFRDGKHTLEALRWIKNASKYDKPFFLAVGYHLPHIPFVYPKEFRYNGDMRFPPSNYFIPKNIPEIALHDWTNEAMLFGDLAKIRPMLTAHVRSNVSALCTAAPLSTQEELKRAYLSSVQFIDHLLGQLVNALWEENLYQQTTIVVFGDHGYKLGEHCDWFKHDNYELSTRFPLLFKPSANSLGQGGSGQTVKRGRMVKELVEAVDIFPSLIETAGLQVPKALDGRSFLPLLRDPKKVGKTAAFSQYPHANCMGYSIRTKQWRYTEWLELSCGLNDPMTRCSEKGGLTPRWDAVCGKELYDHRSNTQAGGEFEAFENENLASRADHAAVVAELHEQLVRNWATPTE